MADDVAVQFQRQLGARRVNQHSAVRPGSGKAQLSLVEHALCPLDPAVSLVPHLVHESAYSFTDAHGHAKTARVCVHAPFGLSASDEFILWGLLALTFAQGEPDSEFQATPHYWSPPPRHHF